MFVSCYHHSRSAFHLPAIANVLPPVDDMSLPLVKLLTHPTYRAYQDHAASLSLIPNTYIKFLPPNWHEPTPPTPAPVGGVKPEDSSEKKEWKRRIKMYGKLTHPDCLSSRSVLLMFRPSRSRAGGVWRPKNHLWHFTLPRVLREVRRRRLV